MKCGEFAKIVHELARSRGLNDAEMAIARAHAEVCPACGCLLADAERLAGSLRDVASESRSLQAPERIERELLAAFRTAGAIRSRSRWKLGWRRTLVLVGASALASLALFAWLSRVPSRRSLPSVSSSTTTVAAANVPASDTASGPSTLASEASANQASGFVPVPFSGGFARGDSGLIVRVQLSRAALAELGYPADDVPSGEGMVQADLIVGEDGWPHAVRIVR